MYSFPSFCRIHLTQGLCSHAWIWHAYCYAPRSLYHHKHAAVVSQSLHKPTLWHLLPAHTHATGTSQSWPVWSANLKRKMRSWWGAEGLVQRRPVEGCRAEKILCGTNTKKKKKTWKRRKGGRGKRKITITVLMRTKGVKLPASWHPLILNQQDFFYIF